MTPIPASVTTARPRPYATGRGRQESMPARRPRQAPARRSNPALEIGFALHARPPILTHGPPSARGQIGFVSHTADPPILGLFCTAAHICHCRHLPFAPQSAIRNSMAPTPVIGFVFHRRTAHVFSYNPFSRQQLALIRASPDWVCFALRARQFFCRPARARHLPGRTIGFVSHVGSSPFGVTPSGVSPDASRAQDDPRRQIGFVLRDWLIHPHPAGPLWASRHSTLRHLRSGRAR